MTKSQRFEYYWEKFLEQKSLFDFYKNPSIAKKSIWQYILNAKGYKPAVLTATSQFFTAGFISKDKKKFVVIKPINDEEFDLPESYLAKVGLKLEGDN